MDSLTAINSLVQYYPKLNVLCHYLYSFNILFLKLITASTADLFLEGMQRIHYTTFESMNNFIPLPKIQLNTQNSAFSYNSVFQKSIHNEYEMYTTVDFIVNYNFVTRNNYSATRSEGSIFPSRRV